MNFKKINLIFWINMWYISFPLFLNFDFLKKNLGGGEEMGDNPGYFEPTNISMDT